MAAGLARRTTTVAAALVLVMFVCAAAYADNYTYKRTRQDDATAASLTLRESDFPAQLGLTGGHVPPDETPNTDSCNGYRPKQSDLIVTGDAESRFHNSARSVMVDSQVELFETTKMAATDVQRGERMLSSTCQAQAARQEHVKLVSYSLLGHPRCSCNFAVTAMLETKTPHPNLDLLTIITAIRKGRFEGTIVTNVGKATNDAQSGDVALQTALTTQGLAVKAAFARLHAD